MAVMSKIKEWPLSNRCLLLDMCERHKMAKAIYEGCMSHSCRHAPAFFLGKDMTFSAQRPIARACVRHRDPYCSANLKIHSNRNIVNSEQQRQGAGVGSVLNDNNNEISENTMVFGIVDYERG